MGYTRVDRTTGRDGRLPASRGAARVAKHGRDPIEAVADGGIRFGRTTIVAVAGDTLEQVADGIVVAANRRGVLGAAAHRAFGGPAVEREAMANAPLELGTAVVTGAAGLGPRGVRAVVHAVVHPALGEPARPEDVRRATAATLAAADRHKLRSLALPLLGVDAGDASDSSAAAAVLVDELVGCLRRGVARPERVVVVARYPEHAAAVSEAIGRARERLWPSPG